MSRPREGSRLVQCAALFNQVEFIVRAERDMTGISRRDFVALTAAGAAVTPFLLDDALAAWRRRGDGAGDRRSREEEHRRRLGQRRRRYVQGGRSVDDRHRRGDDLDGDAGRAAEGRPGRSESHHHRGADVLLEGRPSTPAGRGLGAGRSAGRGQVPARAARGPGAAAGAVAGDGQRPGNRRVGAHAAAAGDAAVRGSAGSATAGRGSGRRRRRPIRSTRARTPSSRSTSWWCSA